MPKVVRCCICGRLCGGEPHDAAPYKNGFACDLCFKEQVMPSKKWKESKYNRYGKTKTY
ncbi:MAG: hypothetical protein J6S85_16780 [Methanobrevibacter sp.]|nr:hypothetical protein [Methanobrevibacter sp.]